MIDEKTWKYEEIWGRGMSSHQGAFIIDVPTCYSVLGLEPGTPVYSYSERSIISILDEDVAFKFKKKILFISKMVP